MTPAEIENVINEFIIDNNTNQVTPAKLRFVLKSINNAIKQTDPSAVSAIEPLFFDPFTNQFSIPKASATQDGYLSKEDYASAAQYDPVYRIADGITNIFTIPAGMKAQQLFLDRGPRYKGLEWDQSGDQVEVLGALLTAGRKVYITP